MFRDLLETFQRKGEVGAPFGPGYGVDLVKHAEEIAREKGLPRVFALTTRAADFFENRVGYSLRDPEVLPASRRRQLEESGRDSKVFEKRL